ncbi:MAG: hypothetical protein PF444_05090 [Bacteroidales bacterium]|nr:hypothetical protein [Bacteroidales bacterium]
MRIQTKRTVTITTVTIIFSQKTRDPSKPQEKTPQVVEQCIRASHSSYTDCKLK